MEKKVKKKPEEKVVEKKQERMKRSLTIKEIRAEREILRDNIKLQFEKFQRRTGLKVTYCEFNLDSEDKGIFLAIEDI